MECNIDSLVIGQELPKDLIFVAVGHPIHPSPQEEMMKLGDPVNTYLLTRDWNSYFLSQIGKDMPGTGEE